MATIAIFTKAELESQKLTDITDQYNQVAKLIGLKAIKKFRDKPTAVSRTLDAQETYKDDITTKLPPQKDGKFGRIGNDKSAYKSDKAPKRGSKKGSVHQNKLGISEDSVIEVVKGDPKEGSIEHSLFVAINHEMCVTVKEIVAYIVANHKRPRSGETADEQYALHNIKWFVKKGHLKVRG